MLITALLIVVMALVLATAGCTPKEKTYTVTLNLGDGQEDVRELSSQITAAPVPSTVKEGYEFDSWYLDAELTQQATFPMELTADITLYAKYLKQYKLTLVIATGISNKQLNIAKVKEDNADLQVERDGYVLEGWYLDNAFKKEVTYPYILEKDTTFYAKWTKGGDQEEYLVKFNTNGGTPVPDFKGTVIEEAPKSTKEGYTLAGWYTRASLSGSAVRFPLKLTKDTTLYAKWIQGEGGGGDDEYTYVNEYRALQYSLETVFAKMPTSENVMGINVESTITTPNGTASVVLKGNLKKDGTHSEFMFRVTMLDTNKTTFAIYLLGNEMYMDLGEGNPVLHFSDIKPDYIIAFLGDTVSNIDIKEILKELSSGMGGIDLAGVLMNLVFDPPYYSSVTRNSDKITLTESYKFKIKLNDLVSGISDLLDMINIKEILKNALKMDIDLNLTPLFTWLNDIIPQLNVFLTADLKYDENIRTTVVSGLNLTADDNDPNNDVDGNVFDWTFDTLEVKDTAIDIEVPDKVYTEPKEFSLSNIKFDLDLNLYTKGDNQNLANPAGLDVAKLVNLFAPDLNLPENMLILNAEFGYRIKARVDLDLNYDKQPEDNNLIALEIYPIDRNGEIITSVPKLLGIYYKDGSLYVSLNSMMPNYWKANNIRIDDVNLDSVISYVVDMVTQAIDEKFGSDWGDFSGEKAEGLSLSTSDKYEVSLLDEEGEVKPIVSPTLQELISLVAGVVGFQEAVYATDDQIVIEVNQKLFDAINQFMKTPISLPIALDGKVALNLFEGGLESVEVQATVGVPEKDAEGNYVKDENGNIVTKDPVDVKLKAHNFTVGLLEGEMEDLSSFIDGVLTETQYESNLGKLLDSALEGIDINVRTTLKFNAGTYAIGKFLEGLGLEVMKDIPLNWTFTEDFSFDAALSVMVKVDKESRSDSMFAIELTAEDDINIGSTIGMAKGTVIMGVYGYYSPDTSTGEWIPHILIDLTNVKIMNITLPRLSFEFDYVQALLDMFDQIKIGDASLGDFDIAFDLSSLFTKNEATGESNSEEVMNALFTSTDGTADNTELTDFGQIIFGINAERIYAQTTIAAIGLLLKQVGVDLGGFDLTKIDFGVSMDVTRKEGWKIEGKGELMPTEGGSKQELELAIYVGTPEYPLVVGEVRDKLSDRIDEVNKEVDKYTSDLVKAIVDTIGVMDIQIEMDLSTFDSHIDFAKIINNILVSQGQYLDLPIDMYLDDWNSISTLSIRWKLDLENVLASKLLIEFKYGEKDIISLGVANGDIVINLEGLGLFSFKITNSNLVTLLVGFLDDLVAKIGNLDLTDIINGLLKPGTQDAAVSEAMIANEIATSLAMADGGQTAGEGDATMDLIMKLLKGVSATDVSLYVDIAAETIENILGTLAGISLGFDVDLDLALNMVDGEIALGLDLGGLSQVVDFNAKLKLKVGAEANEGGTVDWEVDTSVLDINAQNGETFARTLLDRLNIALSIDILNSNIDTGGANKYLCLNVEKLSTQKVLPNTKDNKTAPAGSFLVTVLLVDSQGDFDNTNSTSNSSPLVYIVLDYAAGKMHIYLAQGQLQLVVDLGDYVAVSVDLDLVNMLAPVFQGLIDQIDTMATAQPAEESSEEVATALPMAEGTTEPSPFAEIFADFDVLKLLSGGIDIRLTSAGVFNVDVALNPYVFNKLLDDIMGLVFGSKTILNLAELAPTMFGTNYLANVNWDRVNNDSNGFWQTLKAQLTPMLKEVVTNMVSGALAPLITDTLLNSIYEKIHNILMRILPLPVFNDIHVGLNTLEGTFSNLYIKGYDYNQAVLDEEGNTLTFTNDVRTITYDAGSRSSNYKTEIYLFNKSESVGDPTNRPDGNEEIQGVVDWGDITLEPTFNPYEYSSNSSEAFTAFYNEYFANKSAKYQYKTTVQKQTVRFYIVKEDGSKGEEITASSSALLNLVEESTSITATKKVKVLAEAEFSDGTRSLDLTVNILAKSEINSIDEVQAHAYDEVTDRIALNLANGERRIVNTSTMSSFSYSPDTYLEHEKDVNITFRNGVTATLHVHYLDSTVVDIVGSGNKRNVLEVDLYQFTSENRTVERFTPEYLYVFYADGESDRMKVDKWDVTPELTNQIINKEPTNVSMINGEIKATIGGGTATQVVTLGLEIKTKQVTALGLGTTLDSLEINPYAYFLQQIGYSEQGIKPNTAIAYYYEKVGDLEQSYNEQVNVNVEIKSDSNGIDFNETSLRFDSKGTYNGTVSLDTTKYGDRMGKDPASEGYADLAAGYFTWTHDITVNVVSNIIDTIYFDADLTKTVFTVYPYEFNALSAEQKKAYFPDKAYVKFTSGAVMYMPIRWKFEGELLDPSTLTVDYETYTEQYEIEIGFCDDEELQNKFLQSSKVGVVVDGNPIKSIDIAGFGDREDRYQINPINVLYLGQNPFPSTVKVVYEDGSTGNVNVYSWGDPITVTMNGGETGVVDCMLTADGLNTYQVKYEVLKKGAVRYAYDTIVLDPFGYTVEKAEDGSETRVYKEFGSTLDVYFDDYVEQAEPGVEEMEQTLYTLAVSGWRYDVSFGPGNTGRAIASVKQSDGTLTEIEVPVKVLDVKKSDSDPSKLDIQFRYAGYDFVPVLYDPQTGGYFTNFDDSIYNTKFGEIPVTIIYQVEDGNGGYVQRSREINALADFNDMPTYGGDDMVSKYYLEDRPDSAANQQAAAHPYRIGISFSDGAGNVYENTMNGFVAIMGKSPAESAMAPDQGALGA